MKFTSKIKKISAAALMGAVLIASASTLSVHAQTINQVSVSKPGYVKVSMRCSCLYKI